MTEPIEAQRRRAIHLLQSGEAVKAVARQLGQSLAWVYKWRKRYAQAGWAGLRERSRTPHRPAHQLPAAVHQQIRAVRSTLEAEAAQPGELCYVGAQAIRVRMRRLGITPLPSISTIEREVRQAGMVRPRRGKAATQVVYPHLCPQQPRQLVQIDIYPHYLPKGPCVACFNAIDVVSRYPTGAQLVTKRATDAANFLLQVWRELGIPTYTQVDNESCFSGGATHRYVLGRVLRLALLVGTELIYSPVYHPQSNASVERFHQEYARHVWQKYDLPDLNTVQQRSQQFFAG